MSIRRTIRSGFWSGRQRSTLLASGFCLAWGAALAEEPAARAPAQPAPSQQERLRGVERDLERSTFEQKRLAFEIENLTGEAQAIRKALIEITGKVQATEQRLAGAEQRRDDVIAREAALRRSLQGREKIMARFCRICVMKR